MRLTHEQQAALLAQLDAAIERLTAVRARLQNADIVRTEADAFRDHARLVALCDLLLMEGSNETKQ